MFSKLVSSIASRVVIVPSNVIVDMFWCFMGSYGRVRGCVFGCSQSFLVLVWATNSRMLPSQLPRKC